MTKQKFPIKVTDKRTSVAEENSEAKPSHFEGRPKILTSVIEEDPKELELLKKLHDVELLEPGSTRVSVEIVNIKPHARESGIVTSMSFEQSVVKVAKVLKVASDAHKAKSINLQPGDYVLISNQSGHRVNIGDRAIWFLYELDIIAVFGKEDMK